MNRTFRAGVLLLCCLCFTSQLFSQYNAPARPDTTSDRDLDISGYQQRLTRSAQSSAVTRSMEPVTTELPVFGFDLFTGIPGDIVAGSAEAVVLPANYQLGPGDQLGIFLLGNVQKNMDVVVNVEGKVFLPPVGVIDVWGQSITDFKQVLREAFPDTTITSAWT